MKLRSENSFKRAFKRLVKKNPQIQEKVLSVLQLLTEEPFHPSLKSHKLTGELDGLWSCSVNYDCRIIYELVKDETTEEEYINVIDIGCHDEVY
jgi:addiction module RelE/StbE family toxin